MTKPVFVKNCMIGEGIPKICVPITGKTREQILSQAEEAVRAGADMAEWRIDLWEEDNRLAYVEEVLFALDKVLQDVPLLFTVRSADEGGALHISPEDQAALIERAAASTKVDLADVEYLRSPAVMARLIRHLHARGVMTVASHHDFEVTGTREELLDVLKTLDESGADILKLAVMPQTEEDVDRLMDTVSEMTRTYTQRPVIAMSMGDLGQISRIRGEAYGSSLTFGTAGQASAPGQLPVAVLREKMEALHTA